MAKRMLLAEDDPDNRGIVVKVLTREGTRPSRRPTATPPWPSARRERLDLIVTDLGMPEMDGSGASRQLKADPQTADIPVIGAHRIRPAGRRGAGT
jgi:CheY-like chemotaxis protein